MTELAQRLPDARGETLASCERIIANGLRAFVEVGRALERIRDEELYKAEHTTFEAYCKTRWGLGRSRAYQLIDAASVTSTIVDKKLPPPSNEAQARELTRLPEAEQSKAWAEALSTAPCGVVTAKHVAQVVAKRLPKSRANATDNRELSRAESAPANTVRLTQCQLCHRLHRNDIEHRCPPVEPSAGVSIASQAAAGETGLASDLARLNAQRNADPEYQTFRNAQKATLKIVPSRAQRMVDFVLDGGELALIRLGLDWAVTSETLSHAYREKARTAHPDRGGDPEDFVEVTRCRDLVAQFLGGAP